MNTIKDIEYMIRRSVRCYEHTGPCQCCDAQFACAMEDLSVRLLWRGAY